MKVLCFRANIQDALPALHATHNLYSKKRLYSQTQLLLMLTRKYLVPPTYSDMQTHTVGQI